METTDENLRLALAGESQASRKYLYFAEKADQDGYKRVARLFRAASESETVHARNHLNVMKGIKSTEENLKVAIEGEKQEFAEMYPQFIKKANKEAYEKASHTFDLARKVEKIHYDLYHDALSKLDKKDTGELKPFYVCQFCGNTVEGEPPKLCPICGSTPSMFKLIE